ncbi:MAG: sulfite exporter TauE/SafE family protein, partial [Pseudomonadota bacterium]|nr:sulfite exporter TauE/SafE family protein [Pseudomonadota bacterium]
GTFIAALSFFVPSGHMLWQLGVYIATCNVMGAIVGTFVALKYGSGLIRKLFLVLLVFLIGRMGISILTAAA